MKFLYERLVVWYLNIGESVDFQWAGLIFSIQSFLRQKESIRAMAANKKITLPPTLWIRPGNNKLLTTVNFYSRLHYPKGIIHFSRSNPSVCVISSRTAMLGCEL